MYSDSSNSDGNSDLDDAGRDKKARKRSGGKSSEKKKKHEKHKKPKKSKKHKKHKHQSEDESEEKSDDGSEHSSRNRKQPQHQPVEKVSGRECKEDRGLARVREHPQEINRQEGTERLLAHQGPSRWDSPGEGEGRHLNQNYNHSKNQRTSRIDDRNEGSLQRDERYQRENHRRRSSPVEHSRSPSPRNRSDYRGRPRYSDEGYKRSGESNHSTVSARHSEQYRGHKNGREHHDTSPVVHQNHPNRFDDRRSNRRNDHFNDYNTGRGSHRAQENYGGGRDDGYQRRQHHQSPNHSYRGQRGRERSYPMFDGKDDRTHRGDNRGEYREQRANRESFGDQSRDWRRGPPDDRDRVRRDHEKDRERERERPRGWEVDVKVERNSGSPRGQGRNNIASNHPESTFPHRRGRDRSPMGRGPRREPFRSGQTNEEEQFEWGGGRRNTDSNRRSSEPAKQHVPRTMKTEEGAVKKEEPGSDTESAPPPKQKPNFALSGKLTEETNKVNGTVIAYAEPPGARKPKRRWRLYPFKGEQALPTLYIHRQSCYLIGRDRKVCDLPVDHPSCSKQHAVLQYRLVPYQKEDGSTSQRVRPYIIDLESANGTFVNNKKIEPKRYLELFEKDVLKFGFSSREYVLLHENSKEDNEDDDGYEVSPTSKPFAGANSNVGPN